MSKITLYRAAQIDLCLRYTRHMGGKKYRQYDISYAAMMLLDDKADPEKIIADHILKEEGLECEFIKPTPIYGASIGDMTDIALSNEPKLRKSLEKMKHSNYLCRIVKYDKWWHRLLYPLKSTYNAFVDRFNALSIRLQGEKLIYHANGDVYSPPPKFQLPWAQFSPTIHFYQVNNIAVSCDTEDVERATKALVYDLKLLQKYDLILGHRQMPSMIVLADAIGTGKKHVGLFCSLFVDHDKLNKVLGRKAEDVVPGEHTLDRLGVQYAAFEGEINPLDHVDLNDKYDIEVVKLLDKTEEIQNAVQKAYDDSRLNRKNANLKN